MSVFRPVEAFPGWRDLIPYFGIGSVVGALFSAIVFAATAFSLPMLVWGLLIALAVAIGFFTAFIGFIVLLPLLGHATWHAYRTTIDASAWPETHD